MFTLGDTVYAGSGDFLDPSLLEHEAVHSRQQKKIGWEAWWARYLDDPGFRLDQETEAYRVQYRFARMVLHRKARRLVLRQLVRDLSGPMYGRIIDRRKALELISEGSP